MGSGEKGGRGSGRGREEEGKGSQEGGTLKSGPTRVRARMARARRVVRPRTQKVEH